jgi:hypothetical protein
MISLLSSVNVGSTPVKSCTPTVSSAIITFVWLAVTKRDTKVRCAEAAFILASVKLEIKTAVLRPHVSSCS